jgi:hypothetical protein
MDPGRLDFGATVHAYYIRAVVAAFLLVNVGDVVAVAAPRQPPYLARVICCEGGARSAEPSLLQVVRDGDLAVLTINADWVLERLPGPPPMMLRSPTEPPGGVAVQG